MTILLIIIYGLACCFAIWKMPFVRKSGIRLYILFLLFGLHVLAGWAHNAIAWRYFPDHGDIWFYYKTSFLFQHRLFHQFNQFLADNSRWTFVSHNGVIYVQLLLNLFSFGHMSVNTLLFAFPVFLGNIALFRVFRNRFPADPLTPFVVFLLPSALFWTAPVYREGVLYMLLGFFLFNLDRLLTIGYPDKRGLPTPATHSLPTAATHNFFWCLLCFLLIGYFRAPLVLALFPAILVWWWLERPAIRRSLLTATVIVVIGATLLMLFNGYSLPTILADRQHEFYSLEGHSRLRLPPLDDTWSSLFHTLPAALINGLFEPLPGSGGQPLYLAFAFELLAIWLIAALSVLKGIGLRETPSRQTPDASIIPPRGATPSAPTAAPVIAPPGATPPAARASLKAPSRQTPFLTPFGAFCLTFALLGMLSIGLIVPFAGAIVRYRSLLLPFLLAPFLHALIGHHLDRLTPHLYK